MKENVYEHNQHRPYWKRLYNGLGIWIFFYLMLIASGFYIIAVDFSFEPHQQTKPHTKNLSKTLTNPTNESQQSSTNKLKTMVADDNGKLAIDKNKDLYRYAPLVKVPNCVLGL